MALARQDPAAIFPVEQQLAVEPFTELFRQPLYLGPFSRAKDLDPVLASLVARKKPSGWRWPEGAQEALRQVTGGHAGLVRTCFEYVEVHAALFEASAGRALRPPRRCRAAARSAGRRAGRPRVRDHRREPVPLGTASPADPGPGWQRAAGLAGADGGLPELARPAAGGAARRHLAADDPAAGSLPQRPRVTPDAFSGLWSPGLPAAPMPLASGAVYSAPGGQIALCHARNPTT